MFSGLSCDSRARLRYCPECHQVISKVSHRGVVIYSVGSDSESIWAGWVVLPISCHEQGDSTLRPHL